MTDAPQPVVVPDKQTVYRSCVVSVERLPDGGVALIVTWRPTNEQMVFPMPQQVAETIGKQMCAPSIVVAASNGHPH